MISRKMFLIPVLLSLFILFSSQQQQIPEAAKKYTTKEFNEKVPLSNHFVMFYVPWNGESRSSAQIWEELAQKHNTNTNPNSEITVAKVDCTQEVELCSQQDITDYPSMKFYKMGGEASSGTRHRGVHDFHSLEQFMNSNINRGAEFVYGARVAVPLLHPVNGLHKLQDETFDDAVQDGHAFISFCTPWASKCMDLEPVWISLAKEFQFDTDVLIGQVDCSMHKSTCNQNEVRGYPSLLWLTDGVVREVYPTKVRDFDTLKAYVYKKLGKEETPKKAPVPLADEEEYKTNGIRLDKDNFYEVVDGEKLIIVNFNTPWCSLCMKLDPIWEDLALKFKDNPKIKIATLDCTRNKELCDDEEIEEFPTLNLYRNTNLVGPYDGPHKLEDLVDFCNAVIAQEKNEL